MNQNYGEEVQKLGNAKIEREKPFNQIRNIKH